MCVGGNVGLYFVSKHHEASLLESPTGDELALHLDLPILRSGANHSLKGSPASD